MELNSAFTGHFLFLAVPAWGHLRPMVSFACKAVLERHDIAITLLTAGSFATSMEHEIDRYFSGNELVHLKAHIRVVNFGGEGTDPFPLFAIILGGFEEFYKSLVQGKPIRSPGTGKLFNAIRKPTAAVIDFFASPAVSTIRSVTNRDIPVLVWGSSTASSMIRTWGPEKMGGFGHVAIKAPAEAQRTGRKLEDVIENMYRPQDGKVITVPGLPPMYDYEWSAQEPPKDLPQNDLFGAAYPFMQDNDGIVSNTSTTYESETVEAVRVWLGETNRPFFPLGPLIPPSFVDSVTKPKAVGSSEKADEFGVFLDGILRSHGKNSLIYVSFGSYWWPKNEYVLAILQILLELRFPFILSHAGKGANIPQDFAEKVKQSGIGLLSPWSPQQTILNHPATGWFLTHCGQNSVTESLSQGIPMIAWPIDADQPPNAAHLTLTLDVAFELIEVRTGLGLKPLYRGVQPAGTIDAVMAEARDVFHKARGPDGQRKRRNAEAFRDKLMAEWREGGESLRNLRDFVTRFAA